MKSLLSACFFLCIVAAASLGSAVHATEATVIQNVRLFDGEAVHNPVTVIVKDGIIEKIADAAFDLPDRGRIKPGYRAAFSAPVCARVSAFENNKDTP